jgi:predicted nucleic acid-binding protein
MITAIDSNILIDLIGEETDFTAPAISALDTARLKGALVICPLGAAEISGLFKTSEALAKSLSEMGIGIDGMQVATVHLAGTIFLRYHQRRTKPKDRMLADFLVGAHALDQADALLTRDRGYYRTYFPKLRVIKPEMPPSHTQ